MQSLITARCVPRRRRPPERRCARAPRSRSPGRGRRRASLRSPSPSVRKTTIPSSVRTNRSSRGSAPVSSRTAASIARVSISISSPAAVSRIGSRWVCTLLTSGTSARIAASTCSAMSCAWSSGRSPGSLRWSETSMLPSTSRTLRLWISRTCETVSAAARTRSRIAAVALTRLDVNDDVDPRECVVQRLLDPIGRGVPLSDGRARRDADDDVGEVLSPSAAQPEATELDRRVESRDRPPGDSRVVLRRTVHEHVDVPAGRAGRRPRPRAPRRRARRSSHPRGSRARPRRGRRAPRASRRSRCRSGARSRAAHRCGRGERRAVRSSCATRRSRGRARWPRTSTRSGRRRTRRRRRGAGSRRPR